MADTAPKPIHVDGAQRQPVEARPAETLWRLDDLFETMAEGVVLIAPDGQITQANAAAEAILGRSRSEIIGQAYDSMSWQTLRLDGTPMPPHEMAGPRAMEERQPVRNAGMGVVRPDGTLCWINVSASPLVDGSGTLHGVLGVFADITELINTKDALEATNKRASLLVEANPIPTYTWQWTGETFVLVDHNRAAQAFTNGEITNCVGQKVQELFSDMPGFEESMRRCLAEKATIRQETPCKLFARGKPKHLLLKYAYVEPDLVVVYAEDITASYKAQMELRQSIDSALRSHSFLLAVSQAAQEVQFARTAEQVYQTIGQHVSKLGYHALVLTQSGDEQHLAVAFTTLEPDIIRWAEQQAGMSVDSVQVHYEPGDLIGQLLSRGGSAFIDDFPSHVASGITTLAPPLVARVTAMLGMANAVYATLQAGDRAHGLLVVAGTDLTEGDRHAVSILANQAAIAIENAHLLRELADSRDRLRHLTRETVTAQEEERRRLSHALHDEAGQALTALRLSLELIAEEIPPESDSLRRRMTEVAGLTSSTMDQLRLLARDLRPPALDAIGLDPTLAAYCHEFSERTRLNIDYQGLHDAAPEGGVSIGLYRFLQEALTNIAKHADASAVRVRLRRSGDSLVLSVRDDGRGFDKGLLPMRAVLPEGIGLLGMRERLQTLGGQLEIKSRPGHGTRLVARVPCRVRTSPESEPSRPMA